MRGSLRRMRVSTSSAERRHGRKAQQPAGLVAEPRRQQAGRCRSGLRTGAGATATGTAGPTGPPVWPGDPPQAVVAKDQRPDAVVGGPGDPRPVGGRRQRDQQRPGAAGQQQRQPTPQQLAERAQVRAPRGAAQAARPAPRRGVIARVPAHPQPRNRDRGDEHRCHTHLRLKAEPDRRRRTTPTSASGRSPARGAQTTPPRPTAARAAHPGCCGG